MSSPVARIAPGLAMLRDYRREWLRYDVAAGHSVAAVALPTAIAYAQLAGFPPNGSRSVRAATRTTVSRKQSDTGEFEAT